MTLRSKAFARKLCGVGAAFALSLPASAAVITYDFDFYANLLGAEPDSGYTDYAGVGQVTVDTELFAFTKLDFAVGKFVIDWEGVAPVIVEYPMLWGDSVRAFLRVDGGPMGWMLDQEWPVGRNVLASLDSNPSFNEFSVELNNEAGYFGTGTFSKAAPVPEPSTLALLGLGLFGFGLKRRFS